MADISMLTALVLLCHRLEKEIGEEVLAALEDGVSFAGVARALIRTDAPEDVQRGVLAELIFVLRSHDWSGDREAIECFRDYPTIVQSLEVLEALEGGWDE